MFVFTIFIARSVFVVLLLGLNIAFPISCAAPATKILSFLVTVTLLYVFFLYLPVLRPDVELSLRAKQFQFDIIFGSLDYGWSGLGWGTFIPALASDPDQPYQIEMQLPMLLLQLGIPALIGFWASCWHSSSLPIGTRDWRCFGSPSTRSSDSTIRGCSCRHGF